MRKVQFCATMQDFAPKTMASVNDAKGPFVTSLTTNVKLGKDNFFFEIENHISQNIGSTYWLLGKKFNLINFIIGFCLFS